MRNIFDPKKFENTLILRWSDFLSAPILLEWIQELVDENKNSFDFIANHAYKRKGSQIMVTRFQNTNQGFIIWVDFVVPLPEDKIAIGTTEIFLLHTGILCPSKTLGNIYKCI